MPTRYLYNIDHLMTISFTEDEGNSKVIILSTHAAHADRTNKIKVERNVLAPLEAEAFYQRIQTEGFITLEKHDNIGRPWYGIIAAEAYAPFARRGLAKLEAAKKARENFFASYHPAGYGSTMEIFVNGLNDVVFWQAWRAASCD